MIAAWIVFGFGVAMLFIAERLLTNAQHSLEEACKYYDAAIAARKAQLTAPAAREGEPDDAR